MILTILFWTVYFISLYLGVFWIMVLFENNHHPEKKPIKKYPFVSIIIPAYNEEDSIKGSIMSLFNLDYPKDKIEIMVVNDGSTDNTRNIVKHMIKNNPEQPLRLINKKNGGKGKALNLGLKESRGEFFVCLDADSFVREDALKKMLPYFSSDRKIGAVLPLMKIKNADSNIQKIQWYEYMINMFYKKLMNTLNCIHVAPGPFSIYRKSILEKLGGFDENNLTEDLEIVFRMHKYKYRVVQTYDTEVYTIAPKDIKGVIKQRNRWFKGSTLNVIDYRKMLFNREYGNFGMLQMPSILLSGVIVVVLLFLMVNRIIPPLITNFSNFASVDFDFMTLLYSFSLNFNMLDLDYMALITIIIMIFMSLIFFVNSVRHANERMFRKGVFSLFTYFLFYYLLMGVVWLGVFFDLVFKRVQKW